MTGGRKQKIRVGRPQAPSPRAASGGPARPPESEPELSYFEVRPALLGSRLHGLSALTKPGVRGFPEVDAAQALLAQTMRQDKVRGEVLDLTAMGGLLASLPGVRLRAVEGSAAALGVLTALAASGSLSGPALAAIPGDDVVSLGAEVWGPERARTVALVLAGDRGTAYVMGQVAWAHACTPPGGTLYIAGDRDKGFDRYVRAAGTAFGTGETIARDGGMRVARLVRRPGPTPALPEPERYEAFGVPVVGLPGVFSAGRLDRATTLLLEHLEARVQAGTLSLEGLRVLDLGCGTGIIGAWAAARGAQVTLIDGDLSSVRSARATLAAAGLRGEVIHSDVDTALGEPPPEHQGFDLILTNPPFHVGRGVVLDVAREFIATAQRRLKPGGRLIVVANDPLPYEAPMRGVGEVQEWLRTGGFKILVADTRAKSSARG